MNHDKNQALIQLASEMVENLVDCGSAEPEVVKQHKAWALKYVVKAFASIQRRPLAVEKPCAQWKEEAIKAHEENEELQSLCNALAAESARMRIAIDRTIGWQESVDAENTESVRSLHELNTPATNAYLNSVRAEGVERLANEHQAIVAALNGDCLFSGSESKHADIVAAALYFAAQLRAGKQND